MSSHFSLALAASLVALGCGSSVSSGSGGAGGVATTASGQGGATVTSGSSSATASSSGGNGGSSSTSTGTGGGCDSPACEAPSKCCGDACLAVYDDPFNCGDCGHVCPAAKPLCQSGSCVTPDCTSPQFCSPAAVCCGADCCSGGKICCDVPGPGPTMGPKCTDPDNGTCPKGCPLCQ